MSYEIPTSNANYWVTVHNNLFQSRVLYIMEEIGEYTAEDIIPALHYLDSISFEPITIYINSVGGCVSSGLAIYDAMRYVTSPVYTVVTGQACSMAAVLLAGGDHREATPHARIMIHEAAMGAEGKTKDLQIELEELKKVEEICIDILVKHTGQNKAKVRKDIKLNKYMSAQEAKAYGLIDNVLEAIK